MERTESQGDSPVQTSRHTTVRHEIATFSEFSNTSRDYLLSNDITQQVKHNLQKILARFLIILHIILILFHYQEKIQDHKLQMMKLS